MFSLPEADFQTLIQMSSQTLTKAYTLSEPVLYINDLADDVYKMFIRKLVSYENDPQIDEKKEEDLRKLFEEVLRFKRK